MTANKQKIRQEIIATARKFSSYQLSFGCSGNVSARSSTGFLITPSGIGYDDLVPGDINEIDWQGKLTGGRMRPSTEWQLHHTLYLKRPDINAVVHVHSTYATAVACTRKAIPAFHYMVTKLGGNSIPCAEYATFGSVALAENVAEALGNHMACLLANHGQVCVGTDLATALHYAGEVENLAKQYCISMALGDVVLLDEKEMQINREKFKTYGKPDT